MLNVNCIKIHSIILSVTCHGLRNFPPLIHIPSKPFVNFQNPTSGVIQRWSGVGHAVKQPKNDSPQNQDLTTPKSFLEGVQNPSFEYKNNFYYYFIIIIVLYSQLLSGTNSMADAWCMLQPQRGPCTSAPILYMALP